MAAAIKVAFDKKELPALGRAAMCCVGLCFYGLAEVRLTGTHTKVYATVPRRASKRHVEPKHMSICTAFVRRVGGGQVRQPRRRGAGLEQKTTRRFTMRFMVIVKA